MVLCKKVLHELAREDETGKDAEEERQGEEDSADEPVGIMEDRIGANIDVDAWVV